jgi:N-acetylglucosaminyl-diphospho-decaprenol L-rhamnosyltransferase
VTRPPQVAVVTIVHGRHDHLRRQRVSLDRGSRVPGHHVVVVMGDPELERVLERELQASPRLSVVALEARAGRLPLAAARNAGAQHALDLGAEVLVFLDVDCLAGPDLVVGYEEAVAAGPRVVWSGPVTYLPPGLDVRALDRPWLLDNPHPARPAPAPGERELGGDPRLFWSLSFAMSAEAWAAVGGFHEAYVGYGGEDTDFGLQVAASGLSLGWVGDARAYHQHHPVQDPPVEHLDDILRNGRVFEQRWGHWPMEGWLRRFEAMGLVRQVDGGWVRVS